MRMFHVLQYYTVLKIFCFSGYVQFCLKIDLFCLRRKVGIFLLHGCSYKLHFLNAKIKLLIPYCLKILCCNGVQREHNKKLNNGLPILHKVPPKRDYGRYFCIMAEKGGTSHGGLTEKLSPFFHAKKQEVNAYGR